MVNKWFIFALKKRPINGTLGTNGLNIFTLFKLKRKYTKFQGKRSYFLTPYDPLSNLVFILLLWSYWPSLMKIGSKLWPLERTQALLTPHTARRTPPDAGSTLITIPHLEHYVLRWAKNMKTFSLNLKQYGKIQNCSRHLSFYREKVGDILEHETTSLFPTPSKNTALLFIYIFFAF